MSVRIYQSVKSSTQSGRKHCGLWVVEFVAEVRDFIDSVMAWNAGYDTLSGQVRLQFKSKIDAVNYALQSGLEFEVLSEKKHQKTLRQYVENF